MIVEYIRYKIENERQREFENAYERAGKSLRASPHCMKYELSHCVEEPKNYILRIEWDSQDGHLKGFRTSPEFQTFYEAVRPFFNDIEEMRHYEVTQVRDGEWYLGLISRLAFKSYGIKEVEIGFSIFVSQVLDKPDQGSLSLST